MANPPPNYAQYGRTASEKAILHALARWSPHLKYEHAGQKWLVRTAAELREDGVFLSDRQIARTLKTLSDKGVLAVHKARHPARRDAPYKVYWLRFVRPSGAQNGAGIPDTMSASNQTPCPVHTGHHVRYHIEENIGKDQGTTEDYPAASQPEEPSTEIKEEQVVKKTGAEVLAEKQKAVAEFEAGMPMGMHQKIVLPAKKALPHKVSPTILYELYAGALKEVQGQAVPVFKLAYMGPLKKVLQALANAKLGGQDWVEVCHYCLARWAEFLLWAGPSLPQYLKGGGFPQPKNLHEFAPHMIAYWNISKTTALPPGDNPETDDASDLEWA